MKLKAGSATPKLGTGSWYTERGTYTEPSEQEGMEWVCRLGKRIALVPIKKEQEDDRNA
jgi:hypothetical protein